METQKTVSLPIDKLSYSGLTQLLRNPLIFKLKQILGIYDGKKGVSAMVGMAGHEALKYYYGGVKEEAVSADRDTRRSEANDYGLKYLTDYNDFYINYGKTGTREKMLADYAKAMQMYWAEEPEYNEIVCCEERLEAEIKNHDGQVFPLPAVGKPDLVDKCADGSYDIIDTKFVKSFTQYENADGEPHEDYIKIIQAKFLDYLVKAKLGIQAKRVIFREIKRTENRPDKENKGITAPQVRDYVIDLNHKPYDIIFVNLYSDVVKFISNPDSIYLPNLSDPFDGEQAGLLYAEGLINSDMSDVEVMHKVKDVALVSKKFVPSRLDKIENQNLLPEEKIKLRLAEFGIPVEPVEVVKGASITQYRFKISAGIRMSTFKKHKEDIARALEAKGEVRILAPIPGTSLVGVEVSAEERKIVKLSKEHFVSNTLSLPIGVDVKGDSVKVMLDDMPHLLIAGSTGSGKSILLHSILTALTKQMPVKDMELVLIDPKRVELVKFKKDKHVYSGKILYEFKDVVLQLKALVKEMERRYILLEKFGFRDIKEYNQDQMTAPPQNRKPLHYIVVVIDELADFMMRSKIEEKKTQQSYGRKSAAWLLMECKSRNIDIAYAQKNADSKTEYKAMLIEELENWDVKDAESIADANVEVLIARLAQMARAVGIHLIIATQRPSVDVITGLIKANFPTRIALTTSSPTDSIVILGETGAEKLNGKGDMLFMHPQSNGRQRLQGFMI